MLAQILFCTAAAVVLVLGSLHLIFTFRGKRFWPREAELKHRLESSKIYLTQETTFWKAWIGFNASHSIGAMLFGLIYGYLSWQQATVLFHSYFLLALGGTVCISYVILARLYWFSVPFAGLTVATVCYAAGVIVLAQKGFL